MKTNICRYTSTQLADLMASVNQPAYRAGQIEQFLWKKGIDRFEAMTNLPSELRAWLRENFFIPPVEMEERQQSHDGTIKYLLRLHDGKVIEAVLIPKGKRLTACISSQVGCSLSCRFCATGFLKMKRNLDAYEIVRQVQILQGLADSEFGQRLSHIVYMGMGEPFLNFRQVMESVKRVKDLGISERKITISTVGILKTIEKLAATPHQFHLAISLHTASQNKRSQLMPINQSNPLDALKKALSNYCYQQNKKVTFEYVLLAGVNDSASDMQELYHFAKSVPCKVNLIEYNPVPETTFRASPNSQAFDSFLKSRGIPVSLRRSRGRDIAGGCGQLAGGNLK